MTIEIPGSLGTKSVDDLSKPEPAPSDASADGRRTFKVTNAPRRVLLIGAGHISDIHAEALRGLKSATLWGVTDVNPDAAKRLASRWSIPRVYPSEDDALASGEVDCVHIATSPDTHCEVALKCLQKVPTLVEKPLAANSGECSALVSASHNTGMALAVNQSLVFFPSFLRLQRVLSRGALGRVRAIDYVCNVRLRQITAHQFGHWMFRAPVNLLLELAVHPLSQIVAVAGPIKDVMATSKGPIEISPGQFVYPSVDAILRSTNITTHFHLGTDEKFPFWQMRVTCDDGVGIADMVGNRTFFHTRTRWIDPVDHFVSGIKTGTAILRDSVRNVYDFGLSTARLKPRNDAVFRAIAGGIETFHDALDRRGPQQVDGAFSAHLVSVCEEIARAVPFTSNVTKKQKSTGGVFEIAVIGGTGFIGTHLVERLVAQGHRVGVFSRNLRNLAPIFDDERVVLIGGDVRREADVERAIGSAKRVINLAHGGGGDSYEALRGAMVGGAENIARVCLDRKVERLIHVGSIASLYLGKASEIIGGDTAPDPRPHLRADYARAKAECDRLMLDMSAREGLPVHILRPGVVIGRGGTPDHGGIGFFNNDQHCIGWGSGRSPLPLVLVDDVAEAIAKACLADAPLKPAYNIIGDIRLCAREYIKELARALERPLCFHPKSTTMIWLTESGKWLVKRAVGRKSPRPSLRDFRSRTLAAQFDCSDLKRDLSWAPEADHERFLDRGIRVYADDAI